MVTVGLWVELEAKEGKEEEVEQFLEAGLELVEAEAETTTWFALKIGPSKYGIFDAFENDSGRQAHLSGAVAEALRDRADVLFSSPPQIHQIDVVAAKLGG